MACGMEWLKWLSGNGCLPRKGRLLDIGEACLLNADAEDLMMILQRHGGVTEGDDIRSKIDYLAYRSRLCGHPTIQTLFLSEVMELTNVNYVSFDVVSSRVARRFDLNYHSLAASKRNSFDLVVNFGTTEHIVNQFNAFKVIHEATKPGGYMFHQVPSTGYLTHGYFEYNALMFKELAEANQYEVVHLWFSGPFGTCDIVEDNATMSKDVADSTKLYNNIAGHKQYPVPNSLICVLLRKTTDVEFAVGVEVKTAASALVSGAPFDTEFIDQGTLRPRASFWKRLKRFLKVEV